MRQYLQYSDDDICQIAPEVTSLAGLLKRLGLRQAGGNFANMKRKLQRLGVDCSHWTGQGWNKDQQLKDWSKYTQATSLKHHLIRIRGHRCEECKRRTWNKLPISLELHHKDGDRTHNEPSNLQLCCPNCHSQTDTFRNRKRGQVTGTGDTYSA